MEEQLIRHEYTRMLPSPTFNDERTMPPELRKAHQENDKAVMAAYGIRKGDPAWQSESAFDAMLMMLYQALTEKKG